MRRTGFIPGIVIAIGLVAGPAMLGQDTKPAEKSGAQTIASSDTSAGRAYSGMYTFLKDGEFVQLTVEDEGHVTGFISRFGDGESDKGAFLDQFFKKGKLEGDNLSFTTEIVHGVSFDFKGAVERGQGKKPGDEAYYVLKGTLTENVIDVNKKTASHSQEVALKMFPQDAAPAAVMRK